MPIAKAELHNLVENAVKYANKILVEERSQKTLMPMFHLLSPDPEGKDVLIGTPWNSDFEKQVAVAQVKAVARKMDAAAVVFTTECWMLKMPAPLTPWHAKQQEKNFVRPSESPDRIEAVLIIAMNKARETVCISLQTIRDKPGGRVISLVRDLENPGSYESWMFDGMFKPEEST